MKLLGIDCFDAYNSFDLECSIGQALQDNITPSKFVRREFDEDFNNLAYNKYLREESEKQNYDI